MEVFLIYYSVEDEGMFLIFNNHNNNWNNFSFLMSWDPLFALFYTLSFDVQFLSYFWRIVVSLLINDTSFSHEGTYFFSYSYYFFLSCDYYCLCLTRKCLALLCSVDYTHLTSEASFLLTILIQSEISLASWIYEQILCFWNFEFIVCSNMVICGRLSFIVSSLHFFICNIFLNFSI